MSDAAILANKQDASCGLSHAFRRNLDQAASPTVRLGPYHPVQRTKSTAMANDTDKTLRTGDIHFHVRTLDEGEQDAIEVGSGLRPDAEFEDDDTLQPAKATLLANFLEHAAQFEPQEEELEIGSPKGFADLGALADYLLDAISVMSKADEDNLKALLMAAVMASLKLDAVIDGRGDTQLEWKRFFKKAKTMYDACTPRPYK